jgi:hypothetical protein
MGKEKTAAAKKATTVLFLKGGRPDLNRRPPEPQSGVLTS